MIKGFLRSEPNADQVLSILVMASGDGHEILHVLKRVRDRYPFASTMRIIVPQEWSHVLKEDNCVQFVYSKKKGIANDLTHKVNVCRFMREQKVDLSVILVTGRGQYNLMKKLAFLAKSAKILAYNENLDSFYIDRQHRNTIKGHLRWRRSNHGTELKLSIPGLSLLVRFLSFIVKFLIIYILYEINRTKLMKLKKIADKGIT